MNAAALATEVSRFQRGAVRWRSRIRVVCAHTASQGAVQTGNLGERLPGRPPDLCARLQLLQTRQGRIWRNWGARFLAGRLTAPPLEVTLGVRRARRLRID